MAGRSMPITRENLLKPLNFYAGDVIQVGLKDGDPDEFELHVSNDDGRYPSTDARDTFFSRLPEKRELKKMHGHGTHWICPSTDVVAFMLHELWTPARIKFASEEAMQVYAYLLLTLEHQKLAMQRTAVYQEFTKLRPLVHTLGFPVPQFVDEFKLKGDLRPMTHQSVALLNCLNSDGYGEFMEQGTGKTAVVIGRVCHEAMQEREGGRMHRTIIVAPKNVRQNWVAEFDRFAPIPGAVTVLRGGPIERMKLCFEAVAGFGRPKTDRYTVVVCSYEALSLSWDIIGKIEWDLAVLDESHYIKRPQRKRSKFAHKLRDVSKSRMCLTGTPVCNSPIDLFSQFEFLRKGGSGFKSWEAFRKFYGVFKSTGPRGTARLVDVQNLPFMRERIAKSCFIVKKEEALPNLPSRTYDVIEVEMTTEQKTVYDQVARDLFHDIKRDMDSDSGKKMNVNNILVKLLRLAQITSGFVCFDAVVDLDTGEEIQPKEIEVFEPNNKLEELVKLVRYAPVDPDLDEDADSESDEDEDSENGESSGRPLNEKTIIWAHWRQDIECISERLEAEGINHVVFTGSTPDAEREEAIRRFNEDPDCKIFLGTPGSGGTGTNLIGYPPGRGAEYDTDTTLVVYYSQDWSHPKRAQSEARAHRGGTRKPVRIVDLCVPATIDEEIRARVVDKQKMAFETQDLREVLSKILGRKL